MGLAYVCGYLFPNQCHQKIREVNAQGFYLLFLSNLATLRDLMLSLLNFVFTFRRNIVLKDIIYILYKVKQSRLIKKP